MNKNKIGWMVGGLVLMGVIFYAGNMYGQNKASSLAQGNTGGRSFGGGRGGRGGGGFVTGEILSKDAHSITVKLRDSANSGQGGSKIVFYTDKTTVMKSLDGSLSDLVVGKQISVMGMPSPDGSVNAESIQIRPAPSNGTTSRNQ